MSLPHAERRFRRDEATLLENLPSVEAAAGLPPPDLEEVYREEAPRLARYFSSRLRPGEEAADLVQEAFVRLARFMSRSSLPRPGAYLQRIARNLLYDRSKRLETRLAPFHLPIGEGCDPGVAAEQEQTLEAQDVMRAYLKALDDLPAKTREVFLLHRVDELTYREIGMKLEISIPTVQYHFARALAQIDAALERG